MPSSVLVSMLSMGGLGLILGGGLAFASKKFAVKTDPRIDSIVELLPGANCGACGFPGCSGLAKAIVDKKAPVNSCSICNRSTIEKIAEIVGATEISDDVQKKVARVMCQGGKNVKVNAQYYGVETCYGASIVNGGPKACFYGCIGFGDCEKVCPVQAITMGEDGLPIIDEDKCGGCGLCVKECPKSVIVLTPKDNTVHVRCRATMKGKDVRAVCKAGCIACKQCERVCEFDAIHVENNVAVIDYDKCKNCMACVKKCPTKAITADMIENKENKCYSAATKA
jgi:electron transport complex protein RnfB